MALWLKGKLGFVCGLMLFTASPHAASANRAEFAIKICTAAEKEAKANNIDPAFFARLLWRESLFDPNVVSNKGAQGIAQFMPDTAKRVGLEDPFEPMSAVKASAAFLNDLRSQFGNLGLAAAAYNAGEQRVLNWQNGKGNMPLETQDYVAFITGKDIADWKVSTASFPIPAIGKGGVFLNECVSLASRKIKLSEPGIASAPRKPWGALIAANFNERTALSMYQRLKLRFPKLIADRQPMVTRKKNLSRGSRRIVLVMLGEATAKDAQATCQSLNAAGAPCVARKN
jgi:Transglycosylase SLT domain